ncbi:MAG: potassium channel protein [Archaeoglobaceae archaeon]
MIARFRNVFALLFATIIGGTLAYRIVEGWDWFDCLYMTVITITTTGYSEIHEMSRAGRTVSMFLMLFGIGIFFYAVNVAMSSVFELSKRRWESMIEGMRNHVIVCGYGVMGKEVVRSLPKERVVVVDSDAGKVSLAREDGFLAVHGDATDTATLEKAGIRRAFAIVCCMNDANNAFTSLAAKELNPNVKTVAILRSPEAESKLRLAKIDVLLSPYADAAQKIAAIVTGRPEVELVETIFSGRVALRIEKIVAGDEFAGKTLKELDLPRKTGCLVVAIVRGERILLPSADTEIEKGDVLYMMCKE